MIINANALHIPLADETVQCVVTSPPYWGLRDYGTAKWDGGDPECDHKQETHSTRGGPKSTITGGQDTSAHDMNYRDICGKCGARRLDAQLGLEPTPEEYVANMVAVFREVKRVLRDDGTLFLNLGDSYAGPRSGETSSRDIPGQWGNRLATNNQIKRTETVAGLKPKDLVGIPWRVAFALQADGWWLRSDIIWSKPNPMPESVTDRPTKAHEYIFLLTKAANYYYDAIAVQESASGFGAPGRANGAPPRRSALGPELSATLYTDDGSTTCRGWHDLSQLEIGVGASVATETECFKIIQDVRLKIGFETPERTYVVDLKVNSTYAASAASIAVPLDRLFSNGGPVQSAIPDTSAAPCGAILSGHIGADPFTGTLERAKVTALECAMVSGEFFAARLTLEHDGFSATLFVWSTLWSAHVTSFIPEGSNNITQFTGTRNRRTVWTIPTSPYSGSHFATFPPDLVRPCILAGSSPRACEHCGAPWERVVEREDKRHWTERNDYTKSKYQLGDNGSGRNDGRADFAPAGLATTGWRATCTCDNAGTGRCIVLDPFAGTFTVGMVAAEYGRRAVGIELNPEYIKLARERTAQAMAQQVMPL